MCTKKLTFDDLSPKEQDVYRRAARLLTEDDGGCGDEPCEVCREEQGHRMWCPLADDDEQLEAA